jgi:hypothetical protein
VACAQAWETNIRDGFFETGDVVEQRGEKHVVWIDRKKNIMKLAQVRQRMRACMASILHPLFAHAMTHINHDTPSLEFNVCQNLDITC